MASIYFLAVVLSGSGCGGSSVVLLPRPALLGGYLVKRVKSGLAPILQGLLSIPLRGGGEGRQVQDEFEACSADGSRGTDRRSSYGVYRSMMVQFKKKKLFHKSRS